MSSIPADNRTAVFSMIKNEGDIIGDFLDQALELFDYIYILDHESRDGTYEICKQVAARDDRVHLYRLASSGYPQSQVTTWFTHEIFKRNQPEWLFLLDADEFLPFNSKKEFQEVLCKVPRDRCLAMKWHNIIPDDLVKWKGLSDMKFFEATKKGPFPKVAIPRTVLDTIGEKLTIFQGNHFVFRDNDHRSEDHRVEVQEAPFAMYHIPYRSVAQAEQKLLLGNLAYYNDPSRRLGKGFHWVQMADEHYMSIETRQATIREQVSFYSWPGKGHSTKNEESFLPCAHRFNYPQACDRSILEQSKHLTSVLILWREVERLMAAKADVNDSGPAAVDYLISDSDGKVVHIAAKKEFIGQDNGEYMQPYNEDESSNKQQTPGDIKPECIQKVKVTNTPYTGDAAAANNIDRSVSHTIAENQLLLLRQVYGWMNIPPSSMQLSAWTGHLAFINALIGLARPSHIVELGVDTGCSFLAMCDACNYHGLDTELIGIDTWAGDPHNKGNILTKQVLDEDMYNGDDLYKNLTMRIMSYPMARLMRSDFTGARERVPDGTIDLLHIDGYHTYEAVSHDFSTWFSSLSDRGICMFHDIAVKERDFGVYLLWEELKKKWPSIEFQHCFGLGILFVGEKQPPAVKEFLDIWNSSELERESIRSAAELFSSTFPARLMSLVCEKETVRLQNEIVGLQNQIRSTYNSLSWRITAPLRYARLISEMVFKGKTR